MSTVNINKLGSVRSVFVQITFTIRIIHEHFLYNLTQPLIALVFFRARYIYVNNWFSTISCFLYFSRKPRYIVQVYFNVILNS